MFSNLRQGSTLYILDKSTEPKVVTGYVLRVNTPHPIYKTYNPAVSFGTNMQTVVDIVVRINDEEKEFVGIPSTGTIHSYGDYVIAETKENMIQEVDAMMLNSRNILDSVEQHLKNLNACEDILKQLNPVYAKELQRDEAIEDISDRMDRMENVLSRLESILSKSNAYEQ